MWMKRLERAARTADSRNWYELRDTRNDIELDVTELGFQVYGLDSSGSVRSSCSLVWIEMHLWDLLA
jgi:hypothetical protein